MKIQFNEQTRTVIVNVLNSKKLANIPVQQITANHYYCIISGKCTGSNSHHNTH